MKLRYDTIRKKSLTWTQKLSNQLNLAHVTGKNMKKKKLKQTNAISAHFVRSRSKIRLGSVRVRVHSQTDYGGKDS